MSKYEVKCDAHLEEKQNAPNSPFTRFSILRPRPGPYTLQGSTPCMDRWVNKRSRREYPSKVADLEGVELLER